MCMDLASLAGTFLIARRCVTHAHTYTRAHTCTHTHSHAHTHARALCGLDVPPLDLLGGRPCHFFGRLAGSSHTVLLLSLLGLCVAHLQRRLWVLPHRQARAPVAPPASLSCQCSLSNSRWLP